MYLCVYIYIYISLVRYLLLYFILCNKVQLYKIHVCNNISTRSNTTTQINYFIIL